MAAVTVDQGVPNACAIKEQAFSHQIPANAFSGSNLVYTAKLNRVNPNYNGVPVLPSVYDNDYFWRTNLNSPFNWLTLTGDTFGGTPTKVVPWDAGKTRMIDHASIQVVVRATDSAGDPNTDYAEDIFVITFHEYVAGVTPTPMAKTAAQCAYVINTPGTHDIDCKALGLQPGDTIGIAAGVTLNWTTVNFNAGVPGNPIYLTNVGGTANIDADLTNTYHNHGQWFKVIGQGNIIDPYGIHIRGTSNPGIETQLCYHDFEFAYIRTWQTGFSGISVKSQRKQRPGLTPGTGRFVQYNDAGTFRNPLSDAEMNAITADDYPALSTLEDCFCIRDDNPNGSYPAPNRYIYRSGWGQVDYTEIQQPNRTYRGFVDSTDLATISNPQIGDYVYSPDVELFYIYNLCHDWQEYYDMVGVSLHDMLIEDTGADGGLSLPNLSAGEPMYCGYGDNSVVNNPTSDLFPNGTHSITKLRIHHILGINIAYDAFQLKNAPDEDVLMHHYFIQDYGRGNYVTIGIQDEGIYWGEGASGKGFYLIAHEHGPVSPNGLQIRNANNSFLAFLVHHNIDDDFGKIPLYGRREDPYDGKLSANIKTEVEFATFTGYNGENGTDDDLITVISSSDIFNTTNILFDRVPGLTRITGVTANGIEIFDGVFEAGTLNPISGNAVTNGYYTLANAQDDKWLEISEGVDAQGRHIIRDPYGNLVDWDNIKVGAIQGSPIQDELQYYPSDPEPRFVTYLTGNSSADYVVVYFPRDYYQNRGKKFPIFVQLGGDGETYNGGGQAVAEGKAYSFGYLKNVYDDPDLDYSFIVACPVVNTNYGTTTMTELAAYLATFFAGNPRIDPQRINYGGLSNGASNPIFRLTGWTGYSAASVVAMAPYNNTSIDYTLVQDTHYWGVKDELDGGGNVMSQRDNILALPGRTAEARATVYNTLGGTPIHGAWYICYDESRVPTLSTGYTNNQAINDVVGNTVRNWFLSKIRIDLSIGPPVPIYNVYATAYDTYITFSFNNIAADATGFKIYRKEDAGTYSLLIDTTLISYNDSNGLQQGSTYTYKVVSYNAEGDSVDSPEVAVVFTGTSAPVAPIAVINAGSGDGNNHRITLPVNQITLDGSSSNDPDGTIVTYLWEKVTVPVGDTSVITSSSSVSTTVTGMMEGTYVFRLTVTDNDTLTHSTTVQVTVNPEVVTGVGFVKSSLLFV